VPSAPWRIASSREAVAACRAASSRSKQHAGIAAENDIFCNQNHRLRHEIVNRAQTPGAARFDVHGREKAT